MGNSLLIRDIDDSDALFFDGLAPFSSDQAFPLLLSLGQELRGVG